MTDEELAAIKERWNWILTDALPDVSQAKMDVRALLDEVERLREVVWAVADAGVADEHSILGGHWLEFDGHNARAVRQKARALLGLDSDHASDQS